MKFGRTVDPDEKKLWESIVAGDVQAFTTIVERHQASVSAIAYGIVGDFSASQDIAQETFFAAWKSREKLRDPTRAAAWLCGISRNLAKNWQRKKYRAGQNEKTVLNIEPGSDADDPSRIAIEDEEQQVVWSTLSEMPENYREVMLLYYRQGESISDVAIALEITEEAARQRLSRGRSMLRNRVAGLIEGVLVKTAPGRSFTAKVMSGLVGIGIASKASSAAVAGNVLAAGFVAGKSASSAVTASATAGGVAGAGAKTLAATVATGFGGALIGILGGALGSAAGAFLPAEFAPTETERQFLRKRGTKMFFRGMVIGIAILVYVIVWTYFKFSVLYYLAGLAAILAVFIPYELRYLRHTNKLLLELRENNFKELDPNLSAFKSRVESNRWLKYVTGWKGRRYRSPISFLGLPLLDIQVNDPEFDTGFRKNYTAKGWIAIGDHAYGVLIAMGSLAVGGFAFGGRTIGIIALGGLSVGVFSLGGLAAGVMAIGGVAAGWDAAGGCAIGWNSAAGGGAYAHHVAAGGHAIAGEFAVGGMAKANEANTEAAKAVVEAESLKWMLDYFIANQVFCHIVFFTAVIGLTAIFLVLALTRRSSEEFAEQI